MYICKNCKEKVQHPTHLINGKPLCVFCNKPDLISADEDIIMIGLADILDGDLDGDFEWM